MRLVDYGTIIQCMVKARSGNIMYGIPDELFYIPEIQCY